MYVCSFVCVAHSAVLLPISSSSIFVNKNSFNMARQRSPLTVTTSPCLFSKKNGTIMSLDQNLHQKLTRFGCVGFSTTILLVFTSIKIKMSFIWKDEFFLPKSVTSVSRSQAHLAKRICNHIRSAEGIKLIICLYRIIKVFLLIFLRKATLESKVASTKRNSWPLLLHTSKTFFNVKLFSIFSQTFLELIFAIKIKTILLKQSVVLFRSCQKNIACIMCVNT